MVDTYEILQEEDLAVVTRRRLCEVGNHVLELDGSELLIALACGDRRGLSLS